MPHFLVTIFHSIDFDPSREDAATHQAIDDLNDDMVAKGIRVYVGGLHGINGARSVRRGQDGRLGAVEGPHRSLPDYVGGLWILDLPNTEEAMDWACRAAEACRTPVEVREFH